MTAVEGLGELLTEVEQTLGREHEQALSLAVSVAWWTAESGDHVAALSKLERLVPVTRIALGPEHPTTLFCRYSVANCRGKVGDPDAAVTAIDEFETDLHESGYRGDWIPSLQYLRAEWLTQAARYSDALTAWAAVVDFQIANEGILNVRTLECRAKYADCVGRSGDAPGALALLD